MLNNLIFHCRCQQNTDFRVYHQKTFRCPFKVVEDANYVNISVNAFHYEHVYVIDKSNNATPTKYFKVQDNLILSNLPIPGTVTFSSYIENILLYCLPHAKVVHYIEICPLRKRSITWCNIFRLGHAVEQTTLDALDTAT